MRFTTYRLIIVVYFFLMAIPLQAQRHLIKEFLSMHPPERRWVIGHPLVAKKAWHISEEARQLIDSLKTDTDLDADSNGGQLDALRHAFWMARLTQELTPRKALKLGIAHEKGNRIDFEQKLLEDGSLPDAISSEMDMRNNRIGIEIGQKHPDFSPAELALLIKEMILNGKLWKIKKDAEGKFLDWQNAVIPRHEWAGRWYNPKCIVPSDF